MKNILSKTFAGLFLLAGFASATAQQLIYQDTTTFTGNAFFNGGSANQAGNTITRLMADDSTPLTGYAGQSATSIFFSVANGNNVAVSARPRLRIYDGSGAGGGPGTLIAGFSFNPIAFAAGTVQLFSFAPAPGAVIVPTGTMWFGLTFDNNTGGTGATAAQLDLLGMGIYDPPTIGSSADLYFLTTAAGSHLNNNPAGTLQGSGGPIPANFGFAIQVPEPATGALLGLGVSALLIRRRRK